MIWLAAFLAALHGRRRRCRIPLCDTPCTGAVCDSHAASTVDF